MNDTHRHFRRLSRPLRRSAGVAGVCVLCLCTVSLSSGCHNGQKAHEAAVFHFGHGDIEVARTALKESQGKLQSDKSVLELDAGILDLASGNVTQAEARFRTLRRELEHLEQKDLTEQASSVMSDARAGA